MIAFTFDETAEENRQRGAARGRNDEAGGYSNAGSTGPAAASETKLGLREVSPSWKVRRGTDSLPADRKILALLLA